MNLTNQAIKERPENYEPKSLTLEEMDVLCRKCHHLHDEELILMIGRFFRTVKKFFKQNEMSHHHASPSK